MSDTFRDWLRQQLQTLMSVQGVTFRPQATVSGRTREPDLRVFLWTGVQIHIYVLTEAVKTRFIRQLLQADSAVGVGTMFVVAPDLLPPPETSLEPPEWLDAIHTLTHERIYTYEEARLLQVHLEPIGSSTRCRPIYAEVHIQQLRYARVSIKPRAIRGFWLVADFGGQAFWKSSTRHYQPPPRRQYQAPPHASADQTHRPHDPPPPPPRPRSELEISYELLGIRQGASREEVKAAFRRLARTFHPDVSDLEKDEAEARFKAVSAAYEYIKTRNKW